jgi:hypothetical protein
MVDAVDILAVLPRVVEALLGDLGELAATVEAGLREWICLAGVHAPVGRARFVSRWVEGLAVIEQALVVAAPSIRLLWECVRRVRRPLMVTMDTDIVSPKYNVPGRVHSHFHILQLVVFANPRVLLCSHMWHIAPVVRAIRHSSRKL